MKINLDYLALLKEIAPDFQDSPHVKVGVRCKLHMHRVRGELGKLPKSVIIEAFYCTRCGMVEVGYRTYHEVYGEQINMMYTQCGYVNPRTREKCPRCGR